ncbi:MAG: leucine-rich repeat domain-containing protein [Candidatus Sigynarchaeota archaeon]
MSTVKKCARCGLQNSFSITEHVVCSACGSGYQLCERCVPTWTNNKCPGCGAGPANARWQVMSGAAQKTQPSTSKVVTATPAWQIYDKKKDQREEKRKADGDGAHQGVPLPPAHVSALREIEDAIKAEIKQQEPGASKLNTFVQRDGDVVELYLNPEQQSEKFPLIDSIARISTLEALGLRGYSLVVSLAPLDALPGLKRLAFLSKARAPYPMVLKNDMIAAICSLSKLEELNISHVELDPTFLDQHITRLTNLKKLNISGIQFPRNTDRPYQPPKNIGQLSSLEELDISRIHVSGKPAIPPGLENLPNIKLVHMDHEQNALMTWGKLKARLEENNPAAYPKKSMKEKGLGFLKAVVSDTASYSDKARQYQNSLPEPLKRGWSGISF